MEPFCNTAKAQVSLINTAQVSRSTAIACMATSRLPNNASHVMIRSTATPKQGSSRHSLRSSRSSTTRTVSPTRPSSTGPRRVLPLRARATSSRLPSLWSRSVTMWPRSSEDKVTEQTNLYDLFSPQFLQAQDDDDEEDDE